LISWRVAGWSGNFR